MNLENNIKFQELSQYILEVKPTEVMSKPKESISLESQIGLFLVVLGCTIVVELKKFGIKKNLRLRNLNQLKKTSKIDKSESNSFMQESIYRELRTQKYYRTCLQ